MTAVKSWIQWLLMFLAISIMGIPFLIGSLRDRDGMKIYAISTAYFRLCLFIIGVRLRVSGTENIPDNESFIVMPNHRSFWDIPAVVIGMYPKQVRFVAKQELAELPVLGWCMKCSGHILIDRDNRDSAIQQMKAVAERLSGQFSITIFPEGTRSPGRHLQKFRRGGFHIAKELGLRILPVSISGSYETMNRHSTNLHAGEIAVHYHPPIDPADYGKINDIIEAVKTVVAGGLEDLEPAPAEEVPAAAGTARASG